jgi:divalent metal cation (Fe/Co/Zn/Cd) transporter
MFTLARRKAITGTADGLLAVAVLAGLLLNAALGWWWADPLAAFIIVYYGLREGRTALNDALN